MYCKEGYAALQRAHYQFCQLDNQHLCSDPLVTSLPLQDQCEYLRLSAFFKYASDRNKRNMAISTFTKNISLIQNFVNQGDYFDFDRGLACGIQFGPKYLLVNTKRLKKFMGRSKSCINGCFHKMGYNVSRISTEENHILEDFTQRFGKNIPQPRQWCIRSMEVLSPRTDHTSDVEISIDIDHHDFMNIRSLLNRKSESL